MKSTHLILFLTLFLALSSATATTPSVQVSRYNWLCDMIMSGFDLLILGICTPFFWFVALAGFP